MSAVNSVTLFVFYLALAVVLGLWVGRRNAANPRSYFRAGEACPGTPSGDRCQHDVPAVVDEIQCLPVRRALPTLLITDPMNAWNIPAEAEPNRRTFDEELALCTRWPGANIILAHVGRAHHLRGVTGFLVELRAIRQAATAAGLSRADVAAFFHDTARALVDAVAARVAPHRTVNR